MKQKLRPLVKTVRIANLKKAGTFFAISARFNRPTNGTSPSDSGLGAPVWFYKLVPKISYHISNLLTEKYSKLKEHREDRPWRSLTSIIQSSCCNYTQHMAGQEAFPRSITLFNTWSIDKKAKQHNRCGNLAYRWMLKKITNISTVPVER